MSTFDIDVETIKQLERDLDGMGTRGHANVATVGMYQELGVLHKCRTSAPTGPRGMVDALGQVVLHWTRRSARKRLPRLPRHPRRRLCLRRYQLYGSVLQWSRRRRDLLSRSDTRW